MEEVAFDLCICVGSRQVRVRPGRTVQGENIEYTKVKRY